MTVDAVTRSSMRPSPKISVITVNYNDAQGLNRTLESTATQAYGNMEHLVIDGGSSDGSPEILAEWENGRSNRRFVSEPDRGIYDAMNKGLAMATGDLFVFMNAGDTFYADSDLAFVAERWVIGDWLWGYGRAQYLDADGRERLVYKHEPFSLRRFRLGLKWIPHQATYFSRELLDRIGGYRDIAGTAGDSELELRAALVDLPEVWPRILTGFYVGGAHESHSVLSRELQWSVIRRANGAAVLGSTSADIGWVALMTAYRSARVLAGKMRRGVGSDGRREYVS